MKILAGNIRTIGAKDVLALFGQGPKPNMLSAWGSGMWFNLKIGIETMDRPMFLQSFPDPVTRVTHLYTVNIMVGSKQAADQCSGHIAPSNKSDSHD